MTLFFNLWINNSDVYLRKMSLNTTKATPQSLSVGARPSFGTIILENRYPVGDSS
jgi:hypothetical protein